MDCAPCVVLTSAASFAPPGLVLASVACSCSTGSCLFPVYGGGNLGRGTREKRAGRSRNNCANAGLICVRHCYRMGGHVARRILGNRSAECRAWHFLRHVWREPRIPVDAWLDGTACWERP